MKETPVRKLRLVLRAMKRRCYDPADPDYRWYGANGVTVCEEWMRSPKAFTDWAFATGYEEGLTLDRIDSKGAYTPSNCRWATREEQSANRRNTSYVDFEGEKLPATVVAKKLGIPYSAFKARVRRGEVAPHLFRPVTNPRAKK